MHTAPIRTRILIISDTHGQKPLEGESQYDATGAPRQAYRFPLPEADVAIHCGDLTVRSEPAEFERTFSMLRAIPAPLKLVIPGNHDLALDSAHWARIMDWKGRLGLPAVMLDELRRRPDDVQAIVDAAAQDGVRYLREGTHEFELANGARIRIFASPMTPEFGTWAFQYPEGSHHFDIPPGVDVAITHGPPKDVLDTTVHDDRAGCSRLFDAVHRARPKVHCFGHIHEAWGAKLVAWKAAGEGDHDAAHVIDSDKTRLIEMRHHHDTSEERQEAIRKMYAAKCRPVDLRSEGELAFREGEHTLFVNAAIMDVTYRPTNVPWLVEIDLPAARL